MLKTFSMLIISQFESINLKKDGKTVRRIFDLKNEIKIITSPNKTFEHWKEFLEKHSTSGVINPNTMARFNQAKNFKVIKNLTLAREFFEYLNLFIDEDSRSLCNIYGERLLTREKSLHFQPIFALQCLILLKMPIHHWNCKFLL